MRNEREPRALRTPDLVSLVACAVGLVWSIAAALQVGPTFARMFADFGGPLPTLTTLFLLPWVPPAVAGLPLVATVAGLVANTGAQARVAAMTFAIVWALAMPGLFLLAMYQPIFSVAGAIK